MSRHRPRLYPDVPRERARVLLGDLLVIAAIALFAWLGLKVHDAVDDLVVLGSGVEQSGTAIEDGFGAAAEALGGAPLVGDELSGSLNEVGERSGRPIADAGRDGQDRVRTLATLLGLLTFGLPTAVVLWAFLPRRMARARLLTEAARALGSGADPDGEERRRLIAMRAAFSLPYGFLLRFTADPLGDLAARRYDRLVEAAFAHVGLRPRTSPQ
jgi:hypothetical protein